MRAIIFYFTTSATNVITPFVVVTIKCGLSMMSSLLLSDYSIFNTTSRFSYELYSFTFQYPFLALPIYSIVFSSVRIFKSLFIVLSVTLNCLDKS